MEANESRVVTAKDLLAAAETAPSMGREAWRYDWLTGGRLPLSAAVCNLSWRYVLGPLCQRILECWCASAGVSMGPFWGELYRRAPRIAWPYIIGRVD